MFGGFSLGQSPLVVSGSLLVVNHWHSFNSFVGFDLFYLGRPWPVSRNGIGIKRKGDPSSICFKCDHYELYFNSAELAALLVDESYRLFPHKGYEPFMDCYSSGNTPSICLCI